MNIADLVKGGIDVHTHSSPSIFPRKLTDWEMVKEAKDAGFRGIVLKSHETSTAERAQLIKMVEKDVDVYGGIVLNHFVGGLNPSAVDVALKLGAKFVWFPTISSVQHMNHFRGKEGRLFQGIDDLFHPEEGITLLNEKGQLKEEVYDILDLIQKYDAVLCSGHIAVEELLVLAEAVFQRNINRFLINHPDMSIAPVPLETQKELAEKGAYLEKCFLCTTTEINDLTVKEMSNTMRQVGINQCILCTDFGQSFNVSPIKAMQDFIKGVLDSGITEQEVRTMFVANPTRLIEG
jgi:hypothetical protein